MDALVALEGVERRLGPLMSVAQLRLSAGNPEMFEESPHAVPWDALRNLAACPSDDAAAEWLLVHARPQEMMCVVMGYDRMVNHLRKQDAAAMAVAAEVVEAVCLAETFELLAHYWYGLPLRYWPSETAAEGPQPVV